MRLKRILISKNKYMFYDTTGEHQKFEMDIETYNAVILNWIEHHAHISADITKKTNEYVVNMTLVDKKDC